ncbi:MAG TPA: 23S rRNA pseudouridine(955/2504/2580) synthase RluC [Burkholderiales bacterium]|nr:23S rRNA pseudouridine(955/2504/2580) synthase RluC [Burkholderiales bacterium]
MKDLGKTSVVRHKVGAEDEGQRLDNYLLKLLKGVPKSHIYRIVRSGEVRVNRGRVAPDYRVRAGDELRLPPLRVADRSAARRSVPADARLERAILFEDDYLLALDKPAGMAVHGGSGVSYGVIEQLRAMRPQAKFLELVHRLDRDTSGVLLVAKKRSALTGLHAQLRDGRVSKRYLALVRGKWRDAKRHVRLKLHKYALPSGERRVSVDAGGRESHTVFRLERAWPDFSLLQAELKTGRTHQIRVHLSHLGFPIVGDDKYGDFDFNKKLAPQLKRMFLHASSIGFTHPASGEEIEIAAPLPAELASFLAGIERGGDRSSDVTGRQRK